MVRPGGVVTPHKRVSLSLSLFASVVPTCIHRGFRLRNSTDSLVSCRCALSYSGFVAICCRPEEFLASACFEAWWHSVSSGEKTTRIYIFRKCRYSGRTGPRRRRRSERGGTTRRKSLNKINTSALWVIRGVRLVYPRRKYAADTKARDREKEKENERLGGCEVAIRVARFGCLT